MKAILKYPGAKWSIAEWIIGKLPAHQKYVEPYFGSGAVFFHKEPAAYECINDLSGDVVNLFRTIREDGERLTALVEMTPWAREEYNASTALASDSTEQARRFLVHCWQSFGRGIPAVKTGWKTKSSPYTLLRWANLPTDLSVIVERLRATQIECRPAIDIIRRHRDEDTLLYCDPPYPRSLRRRFYEHEMTNEEHEELLDALLSHPGPVALSGYHCELYDARLVHWRAYEKRMTVEQGETRTEVLWVNRQQASNWFEIDT
jgi:DNA adenine methylase